MSGQQEEKAVPMEAEAGHTIGADQAELSAAEHPKPLELSTLMKTGEGGRDDGLER